MAQLAALPKGLVWAMTAPGYGDLWEVPSQRNIYPIPTASRDQFVKSDVQANRDFVLSPDRALFADFYHELRHQAKLEVIPASMDLLDRGATLA